MSIYWSEVEICVHVATSRRASIGTVVEVYVHVATAECTSCWSLVHVHAIWMMHQLQVRGCMAQLKKKNNYLLKRCMELLANKVCIQGMEVLLADKVRKQEPQRKWLPFTQPFLHV